MSKKSIKYYCTKCKRYHFRGDIHFTHQPYRRKTNEEKFVESLHKNYKKLKIEFIGGYYVPISQLRSVVMNETGMMVTRDFDRQFMKLEGKYYSVVHKKMGLPSHGSGLGYDDRNLYKIRFYK